MFTNWWRSAIVLSVAVSGLPCHAAAQSATCNAQETFRNVNSLLQSRNYEAASRALDQLRRCPDLSGIENFQMGWLYGRARDFNTALKMFHSVSEDVPDLLTHHYAVALSKFELADYRGAVGTLKNLPPGESDAKCANLLAVSYSKLGLYPQAYAILTQETQKDPQDLTAFLNLVTVCAETGNFEQAASVSSEAARLFPQSSEVLVVKGAANILLGHLDQAYSDFSAAVHLDPSRSDTRFFLALTDYKQAKFSDAAAVLQAATKDGLIDSDLHYLLAECLLKLDSANTAEAMTELNQAIALNGNSVSARTLRGRLLLDAGHPKEAVADLEFASHHDPESRGASYNLARAYRALGKEKQARALFQQLRGQTADTLKTMSDEKLNSALAGKGAKP
ncbi:MAG TPA: tetratricopeptide repeat protein [Bryobacteraceae bacterium]|nr:tetratricopeptide repeat protein [Bryobacteraceae bacterium]